MKKDIQISSGNASLAKGLILLDRILNDRGRTLLVDLIGDLRLTRSTLYRLLGALEARGLIVRVGRGRYDVGVPLTERMRGVSVAGQIAQVSRPFLQSLARDCRATAHLGVMDNDMVTYLVKASSSVSRSAKIFTKENFQLEAYCSGIGKVLLAWQPDIERERYLAGGPFVAITSNTITNPKDLRACLERVRNDGFAADDGEIAADLYCLAVPLVSRDRPIEAAISLSFNCPEGRPIQGDAYLDKLRASATRIAAKLWPSERLAPLHNEIAGS